MDFQVPERARMVEAACLVQVHGPERQSHRRHAARGVERKVNGKVNGKVGCSVTVTLFEYRLIILDTLLGWPIES